MADNKSLEQMIAETMKNKQERSSDEKNDSDKASSGIDADKLKFKYYDGEEDEAKHTHRKKSKKKKKAIIVACSVLGFILLFMGIIVAIIFRYINMINIERSEAEIYDSIVMDQYEDMYAGPDSPEADIKALESKMKANFDEEGLMQSEEVMNVLFLGTDSREDNARGRSDCILLVSLNKATKEIIMTSFLRDIYVSIPGIGNSKLTHAYAYGGADLTIDTIEQNFKIKIDKYVQVNFDSFVKIIDRIDGIELTITEEEVPHLQSDSDGAAKINSAGTYTVNGEQALYYARLRYVGTDFARTQRQRTVFTQVMEKVKLLSVGELNDIVEEFLPEVTTNFIETEIFSMVVKSPTYFSYTREELRIPVDDSWEYMTINGLSVIGTDFEQNKKYLYENIYRYTE